MAGIWDKLSQGQRLYMDKQKNAMAVEKYSRAVERDQQMRNILSESVTPSRAAMPQEEAMGPLPMYGDELPDYPTQEFRPAKMDIQNALGAMYEGGLGPEALAFEQKQSQARLADRTPSKVREHKYFMSEIVPKGPKAIEQYMNLSRAPKVIDYGSGFGTVSQADPTKVTGIRKRELKPEQKLSYIGEKAGASAIGKEIGDTEILLADMETNLPNLQNVVTNLSGLSKIATYTSAGMARDMVLRQTGQEMSEGGIARKKYTAIVRNEILPLLRITFGAAFTVPEGEKLEATLGDPDATPKEKQAVLDSFIESKIAQIRAKAAKVDKLKSKLQGNQAAPQDNQNDKAALQWANQNPNDPRAMKILQKLGTQ